MKLLTLLLAQITFLNPFGPSQIRTINPFAAPQGAPLVAASVADYPCAAPPVNSTGYVPREGTPWLQINDKLGMNNGLTWNHQSEDTLCLGTQNDFAKTILRDLPYYHGQNDPSTKRRAEFETASKFQNGADSWMRYEFTIHVDNLRAGMSVRLMQVHWPSGASPAIGDTVKYGSGGLRFVVSTKSDSTDNVTRGDVPLAMDSVHSVVVHFKLGSSDSFEDTYLDGKLVSHFAGPVGSVKENGYRMRLGNYGALNGGTVVTKYRNLSTPKTATTNMSGFIAAPPAW